MDELHLATEMIGRELGAASAAKAAARVRRERPQTGVDPILAVDRNALDGRKTASVVATLPAHADTSIPNLVDRKVADTVQAGLTERGAPLPLLMSNLERKLLRLVAVRELAPHTRAKKYADSS